MKSGLEDRNNPPGEPSDRVPPGRLNEVRPGRPEQSEREAKTRALEASLNEVRPGRPEHYVLVGGDVLHPLRVSMKSGLEDRNNRLGCGVRIIEHDRRVSMKSGLEDRNNWAGGMSSNGRRLVSMKSGLEGRNNSAYPCTSGGEARSLNEVRPRRPEQLAVAEQLVSQIPASQ